MTYAAASPRRPAERTAVDRADLRQIHLKGAQQLRYAETGVNLEIDLTRGSIEKEQTDPELTRLHLGGQGTAVRILWDRVPPDVEPFSPDNLLIFSSGLLDGTAVAGATRTVSQHLLSPDQPDGPFVDGQLLRPRDEICRL